AELRKPFSGTPVEPELRGSVDARDHLDVAPTDAARELVPRQRLVRRLLGGETNGEVLRGRRLRRQKRELVGGEQAREHAILLVGEHPLDARNVDGVYAEAENHAAPVPAPPHGSASSA